MLALGACSAASGTGAGPGVVGTVIAAENDWGSIAAALGGDKVHVTSIISNPNADPHSYEPSAADARSVATAGVVIENGIGYDGWAQKLIDSNPAVNRDVLDVGDIVGVKEGGNPHQWYSPTSVRKMVEAIVAAYDKRDPADAGYFDSNKETFLGTTLAPYFKAIESIATKFEGTPIGASESIFEPMASATKLDLLTPSTFLRAISEGAEPTIADKTLIDRQINTRAIKVYVFNTQNSTPDVARQVEVCKRQGIPIVNITETLTPLNATFEQWQLRQLLELEAALARTTGRAA
ncbi:MAG: metal ABC transporter solute-binding protein, Zn/Mn family [Actinomycetota bacterium]